jgi:fatty-acyl-CoA synthase
MTAIMDAPLRALYFRPVEPRHFAHWPAGMPRRLALPPVRLHDLLARAASRHPDKPATVFDGTARTYGEVLARSDALAAHLQRACGVAPGDRVLLDLQNGHDFVVALFGILRADAIAVPVSPANVAGELAHYLEDAGARVAVVEREVASRFAGAPHEHLVVMEDFRPGGEAPAPSRAKPGDLCLMPYTSGSTGQPNGCMHTHATCLHNIAGSAMWKTVTADTVALATAPFFHVTGLIHSFLATVYAGGTMVIQRRWDPQRAAALVERHRCTHWDNVPTMVVDLLSHPQALRHDLTSMKHIFGGGSAMPEAIAQKLYELCGVRYLEGYGMTETISQTHMNPPQNCKQQCLGIPTFDTEALVVDPDTLRVLAPGEQGEIVVRGPQLLVGYWGRERAFRDSWAQIGARAFFRTGDLGRTDEDGFFFISDRLKRMINAAGYKVWPAEVEATMYQHPAIKECCVIASPDARRGETVKLVAVLKPGAAASAAEIVDWARGRMAAYKAPRLVEFAEALPRTPSGKLMWRALQEAEFK